VSVLSPPPAARRLRTASWGWRSRLLVLGEHEEHVVSGGIFRGIAFAEGRTVGVWRFAGARVVLEPFVTVGPAVAEALARDGDAVVRFLGR
jgi:hypothetical protein